MPEERVVASTSASSYNSSVKPPQPLILGDNKAESWKIFKRRWTNYELLSEVGKKPHAFQVAMFENCLSDDAIRLLNGFSFATVEENRTVKEIVEKFEEYAVGEVNDTMERYIFHNRVQKEGEEFDNFLADIRRLALTCKFCNDCEESMVRDRVVLGVRDDDTREALLKERGLKLKTCIDICRAAQSASVNNRAMRSEAVARVSDREKPRRKGKMQECKFCGKAHPMKLSECPAYGKDCAKCGEKDHFAIKCTKPNPGRKDGRYGRKRDSRSGRVYKMAEYDRMSGSEEEGSDTEFCKMVEVPKKTRRMIKCRMVVGKEEVIFQVDTGATINLLPARYCPRKVDEYTGKMLMWDKSEFKPLGSARLKVINPKNGRKYSVPFVIYDDKHKCLPILGNSTSQQMGLVKVNQTNFDVVATMTDESKYREVFEESLGQLPGVQSLKIRPDAQPTIMAKRRIPIAVRPKLKEELQRLVELKVITPVREPTPWVSQIVVAPKKSGKIRICMDPHELNKVLLREHFTLPVLDDVLHELRNAKIFTKVDLASGYWHVKLDETSSKLTTFQTPFGRFRWLRLPFGLNVSSEIFQSRLLEAFAELPGIVCIADDVVIHGASQEEHDQNVQRFLQRCQELGVRLNKEKTESSVSEITFMGHKISANGVHIDPEKVKSIENMREPQNVEELRRFLGIVNYVAKFLPNLTDELYPLHNLLKKEVSWNWSDSQRASFNAIKHNLTKAPVLAFYSPDTELVLENDASEYGLGSVMFQNGNPVAYASRTLSIAERRYAQIEKEMLAVTYGLEKFHHFTYGREVKVITDHKPLVSIVGKPLSKAPRRLQNLLLRAMNYNYVLEYKAGKEIPVADALSRAPNDVAEEEECVNNVSIHHMSERRLNEIRGATLKDDSLMELSETIIKGWPREISKVPEQARPYFHFRDELAVQDGILMRGDRVIIPRAMRPELKKQIHAGHLGINSCLRRAKDILYWPGMSAEIRQYIETCGTCATYQDKQPQQDQVIMSIPPLPWQRIGVDIASFGGKEYLIIVDYHSNFFEFDLLPDLHATTVIMKIKMQLARHGIPECLVSDNGTQFTAQVFKDFMRQWNITHETISPGNSKANGAAESAVKIFKRIVRKCKASNEDPFLGFLNLRNTPTAGMTTSPAQRLMGRQTRALMPVSDSKLEHREIDSKGEAMKKEDKRVREGKYSGKEFSMLKVGENVRIQPYSKDTREWKEGKIEKQITSRSYQVKTSDGKSLRRNRQHLREKPTSTHTIPATDRRPLNITTCRSTPESNESQPKENTERPKPTEAVVSEQSIPTTKPESRTEAKTQTTTTRAGREIKKPARYRDD
jgi:hypothetical protein